MFLRKSVPGIVGMILAVSIAAFAQQPQGQAQTPDETFRRDGVKQTDRHRERMERRKGMGRHGGGGDFLRELNLTEEQRQQSRAIMQRRMEGTKLQREELFKLREKRIAGTFTAEDEARTKVLHQEIRSSMEAGRAEMEAILTVDQKAKLEELKKERKAKHEQRKKEREELLNKQQ